MFAANPRMRPYNQVFVSGERHYLRIQLISLLVFLVLTVLLSVVHVKKPDRSKEEAVPERIAKFVLEQERLKAPPPVPTKPVEQKDEKKDLKKDKPDEEKPVEKPPEPAPKSQHEAQILEERVAPSAAEVSAAREKASRSGLLALKNDLADLGDADLLAGTQDDSPVITARGGGPASIQAGQGGRSVIGAAAVRGSGGVGGAGVGRDTGTAVALAGRASGKVSSGMARALAEETKRAALGRKAGRSSEETNMVFDRNKAAIDSIYRRAAREDATLQGKLVLELVITPQGKVESCKVAFSELNNPEVERKIVERVKLFDFGSKDVDPTTVRFTYEFLPAS